VEDDNDAKINMIFGNLLKPEIRSGNHSHKNTDSRKNWRGPSDAGGSDKNSKNTINITNLNIKVEDIGGRDNFRIINSPKEKPKSSHVLMEKEKINDSKSENLEKHDPFTRK
jgi:hypothetical protein